MTATPGAAQAVMPGFPDVGMRLHQRAHGLKTSSSSGLPAVLDARRIGPGAGAQVPLSATRRRQRGPGQTAPCAAQAADHAEKYWTNGFPRFKINLLTARNINGL